MGPTGPLLVVIYSQNNKFVTGLKIKATGGSNFNLSPDYHFIYPGKMNDQLQEKTSRAQKSYFSAVDNILIIQIDFLLENCNNS